MRRRSAEPGHRPRCRFAAGRCPVCGAAFVLDRAEQPWARARTCSTPCAKRLANRDRTPVTCRHCDMVEDFYLAQDADIRRIEVCGQDEDARPVTFREWLVRYEWEAPDLHGRGLVLAVYPATV